MSKRVLIVMPTVPFPPVGADEQNRLGVIRLFKQLGFEVSIVAKNRKDVPIEQYEKEYGVSLTTMLYRDARQKNMLYYLARLCNPLRWDGAADEYFDEAFMRTVEMVIEKEKPDLALIEYSFVYPVARVFRKRHIPVFMRSHNFEPLHFLSEDGASLPNLLKFCAKLLAEYMSCAVADIVFALTPKEAKQFQSLGCPAEKLLVLHSGALPFLLSKTHTAKSHTPVELLFMGSRYTIPHNLRAAEFLIRDVMPRIEKQYPNMFRLNITGGKLPEHIAASLPASVRYLGYVEDIEALFAETDAVISPHLAGHGMQLKVFEPLCRGIPVITSRSVLGGYPFTDGTEILYADSAEEFISAAGKLISLDSRRLIGDNARMKAGQLFNEEASLSRIRQALERVHLI